MPTVEQFLDIFEALSRKDWQDVKVAADKVAEYERKKKHYSAANKIKEAIDLVFNNDAMTDYIVKSALPTIAPPIDLLKCEPVKNTPDPIIANWLQQELSYFFDEWESEKELSAKELHPRNTILFHGPPGCGKTMLAKHIAKKMGKDLYTVQFDSLVSSYLGETSTNLKKIFDFAAHNKCILFIDEIDAIAKLRDDKSELGELKRVVITLLQNIDSFPSDSLLIAATNHAHMLDSAVWRRFDITWEILPPKDEVRIEFFTKDLQESLKNQKFYNAILDSTRGMSGAEITRICNEGRKRSLLNKDLEITEAIFLSILDHLRRYDDTNDSAKKDQAFVNIIGYLRDTYKKKYTYSRLEDLTGISHSTLHHKVAAGNHG